MHFSFTPPSFRSLSRLLANLDQSLSFLFVFNSLFFQTIHNIWMCLCVFDQVSRSFVSPLCAQTLRNSFFEQKSETKWIANKKCSRKEWIDRPIVCNMYAYVCRCVKERVVFFVSFLNEHLQIYKNGLNPLQSIFSYTHISLCQFSKWTAYLRLHFFFTLRTKTTDTIAIEFAYKQRNNLVATKWYSHSHLQYISSSNQGLVMGSDYLLKATFVW